MSKSISFRNPSIKETKNDIEKISESFDKFTSLFNNFETKYVPRLEDAILSEKVKDMKKIAKKYGHLHNGLTYPELHKAYILKQVSEKSPEDIKTAVEDTDTLEKLTVTEEEVTLKVKPKQPFDNVCQQVIVNGITCFADTENCSLLDENLNKIGHIVVTMDSNDKYSFEYIIAKP